MYVFNLLISSYTKNLNIYFLFLEILSPQRPPAPPTEYLQVNIGGYDPYNLLSIRNDTKLEGYVGCIRGLKIGNNVVRLIGSANNTTNITGMLLNFIFICYHIRSCTTITKNIGCNFNCYLFIYC